MLVLHDTIRCTKSVAFILMLSLTTHMHYLWVRVAPIAKVRPTAVLLLSGKKNERLTATTVSWCSQPTVTTTKLEYGSMGKG